MAKLQGRGLLALRVASGVCALSLLVWTFHGVDLGRVSESVTNIGVLGLALIAAPALIALGLECIGWSRVFLSLGQRVRIRPLLRVRLMTEAVARTLPLGVIWAESLKPMLLGRHAGQLPASRAIAGLVARKYLLVSSQAIYVALLSALGFATLCRLSLSLTGHAAFAWGAICGEWCVESARFGTVWHVCMRQRSRTPACATAVEFPTHDCSEDYSAVRRVSLAPIA
ncbi:MAG: hypothetical protein WDO74_28490 [Pseudomonadota bacterium]